MESPLFGTVTTLAPRPIPPALVTILREPQSSFLLFLPLLGIQGYSSGLYLSVPVRGQGSAAGPSAMGTMSSPAECGKASAQLQQLVK